MTIKKMLISSKPFTPSAGALISSAQGMSGVFVVPNGVTRISVLVVEPGGILAGGKSRYLNNVPVTPGQQFPYTFTAGAINTAGTVSFGSILSGTNGGAAGATADPGSLGITPPPYAGGTAGSGGAGGTGGRGVSLTNPDILTAGPNTPGGPGGPYPGYSGGKGSDGQFPGGGAGTGGLYKPFSGAQVNGTNGTPAAGCIRIIWQGDIRQYPTTRTADETKGEISWTLGRSGMPADDSYFNAVATDKAGVWIGFPSVNSTSYYRSTDNAKTFQKLTLPFSFQAVDLVFGNGVFVAFGANIDINNMIRSTDYGVTWSTVATPWPGRAVAFGNGVFSAPSARTSRGTYSVNNGASWSTMTGSTSGTGDRYSAATFNGTKFVFAGVNLLKTSIDGKALVDAPNETRGIVRLRSINGRVHAILDSTSASFVLDPELATGTVVATPAQPFDLEYGLSRLFVGGPAGYLGTRKDGEADFKPATNLSNNLGEQGSLVTVRRIYFDGAGVVVVFGSYGLLMRGELR